MMMLGVATCHGCSYAGLSFNYSDGTSSPFIQLPIGGSLTTSGNGAIEVAGKKSSQQSDGKYVYEYGGIFFPVELY